MALLAAAAVVGYCLDRGRRDFAGNLYPSGILDDRFRHIDDPCRHILPLGRWKHENDVYQDAGIPQAMAAQQAEGNPKRLSAGRGGEALNKPATNKDKAARCQCAGRPFQGRGGQALVDFFYHDSVSAVERMHDEKNCEI